MIFPGYDHIDDKLYSIQGPADSSLDTLDILVGILYSDFLYLHKTEDRQSIQHVYLGEGEK